MQTRSATVAERVVGIVLLCVVSLVSVFVTTGVYPRTGLGWLIFTGFAPIVFIVIELVGEVAATALLSVPGIRHVKGWVERATAERRFSWLRIGMALLAALGFLALGLGVILLLAGLTGGAFRPLGEFFRMHFGAV